MTAFFFFSISFPLSGIRQSLRMGLDMGTAGSEAGKPLECPRCARKVAWNGVEYVCLSCPWTEFQEKPPSASKIDVPGRDSEKKKRENPKDA